LPLSCYPVYRGGESINQEIDLLTRVTYLTDKESRGKTTKVVNLYRLSPLLESRVAIDTQLEMLDSRKTEEIVGKLQSRTWIQLLVALRKQKILLRL